MPKEHRTLGRKKIGDLNSFWLRLQPVFIFRILSGGQMLEGRKRGSG